jgi:PASTA domain
MAQNSASHPRTSRRVPAGRRGVPSGRVVVGDYVGQVAAVAVQVVRRAGLRSGLDRSFGCDAELTGLVVAQEPEAGSDLARNAMVTLYVAAPGNASIEEESAVPDVAALPAVASAGVPAAETAHVEALGVRDAGARRRRKPGLAGHAPQVFDPPPAPVLPGRGPAEPMPAATVADAPPADTWVSPDETWAPEDEESGEGVVDEGGDGEFSHEEFVVHMDDVLAGRTGRAHMWRRVYPRRRTVRSFGGDRVARAWLAEHPRLVKTVGAALAVWAVVGLAAAFDPHRGPSPAVNVVAGGLRRTAARTHRPHTALSVSRVGSVRAASGSPRPRIPSRHGGAARPRRVPVPATAAVAHREAAGTPAAAPPPPVSAAGAGSSEAPAPEPEQSQGGPFSP